MKKDLNLLPEVYEETPKEREFKRMLAIGSPVVLIGYLILLVLIYIYANIQTISANDLKNKITLAQNSISSQKETEGLYLGIKTKLTGTSKILSEQINYASTISHLEEITPPEIFFTNLEITDRGEVEVSFSSPDSSSLSNFINNLLEENRGGKYFLKPRLTSLILSKSGAYLFSLKFSVKKG